MTQLRLDLLFSKSRVFLLLLTVSISLSGLSCSQKPSDKPLEPQRASQPASVGQLSVPANPQAEDGQWMMPAKDYSSTRYSGLDQINTENVKNLRVAWTFSTGVDRGQEAAPLIVGTT